MNKQVIRCPYCGAEYVPEEIYIPEDFLGSTEDIIKDKDGKIVSVEGTIMNLHEEYECDKCGHTFSVNATVSFETSKNEMHDFGSDYESKLYNNREALEEN